MSLIQEAGFDELIWHLVDAGVGAVFGAADGQGAGDEEAFRAAVAGEIDRLNVPLSPAEFDDVLDICADDVFRFGPLTPLMLDPQITDIVVNGPDEVRIDRGGGLDLTSAVFRSHQHLYAFIVRHLGRIGKTVNRAQPTADGDLPDGSRLHVVVPPVSGEHPVVSIRKFRLNMVFSDIIASGAMSRADGDFLLSAVQQRKNIIIAGGPGAGKTTLMGALLDEVDARQRIVGIEDVPELRPRRAQYVRLLTRRSNGPFILETSARDLVREALRMRPDRLVVGEVRGPEALDMISAMSTGMDGSMTTIHASSTQGAVDRLNTLLELASGSDASSKLAQGAVDLIIFIKRDQNGRRTIQAIDQRR